MGKKTKTLQATRPRLTSSTKWSVQGVLCFRPCSSWYDGFAASIIHIPFLAIYNLSFLTLWGGGGFFGKKKRKRKRKKLTHMALIHNADPACSERAEDDSTLWWANDVVLLSGEQDNDADNKHTQTEKVGSPKPRLFLHCRRCDCR